VAPVGARQTQAQSPVPQIQNGKAETRTGAAIDREIATVSPASSTEPVWVAWRAAMIKGDRDMCSWYSDRLGSMRGMVMDDGSVFVTTDGVMPGTRPSFTTPTGPIPLEAGTSLVVLARVIGGSVERLRTVADDCPLDAGGRAVYWLANITSAESLRFLTTLTRPVATDRTMFDLERTLANAAARSIGYHQDESANGVLDGIATNHPDTSVRRSAAGTLASLRGAAGLQVVRRLLAAATDPSERRSLVGALGQSREPAVVDALRPLTRDADAQIRSDAAAYLIQRGGAVVIPEALKMMTAETDDAVRRRIVSSIGRLPGDAGVSALLQLARSADNAVIRKEAVSALSQSKDARALAFMEEILKR
jgi:hypothetical protein